ncbi:hypothetical protein FVA74_13095 [Salinibacterium sp. dk2585]|uniref:hypothetical protein n=1 Tax=unclassified Salinibacterium TaxID=2632331 RepID=UPI0011C253DF|nr:MULTISPECIES: hypothetical protein [unclassified Salinibacterium]QEE62403.1 hypothetical protein FVA74_13095 [Salinibacterium sp. dk2585]TXK52714.1 hypothetical protein FVP63_12300 [Salinibacterium sp. dk5596]
MSEQPGVDPRFPAVFQRGYAGGGETRAEARRDGAGSVGAASHEVAARQPVAAANPSEVTAAPDAAAPTARTEGAIEEREPRVNPFIVVLWVLSLALTVGGVRAITWTYSDMSPIWNGNGRPIEMMLIAVINQLAGPVIGIGLLGILGLLFWHAAAWRRRAIAAQRHPDS